MIEAADCYGATYRSSRQKFLSAAISAGGTIASYCNDAATSRNGAPLMADVAVVGDPRAPKRLLVISGTHGLEGICGSAQQVAWMLSGKVASLARDCAVVLLHGLNPWGFEFSYRTTENNVDLNRNFIVHDCPPENDGYAELHPRIMLPEWTAASVAQAEQALQDFEEIYGADRLYDVLARGQYTHSDGVMYGGNAREWPNIALEQIVEDHLSGAEKVGLIDWHTGIGSYGEPFFLCFNDAEDPLFQRAASWWGSDAISDQRPHGIKRPTYQGLVFHGVQTFLGDVPMCGAVVEFGTRGVQRMRRATRLDQWLRKFGEPGTERFELLQTDLKDAFVPFEQAWRDNTVVHGLRITQQAVDGLAAW